MGKHNGKSRKHGLHVGAALANRAKGHSSAHLGAAGDGKHTTDAGGIQSVLERNDLDELMAMATLANRDFTADRGHAVVVSSGAFGDMKQRSPAELAELQKSMQHRLTVPRRPAWTSDMTPEQLDQQERSSFLEWRRGLAELDDELGLMLTPFEKNLEVWRQLWRVLERSDVVVQVVDARDPLLYWSSELQAYAHAIHPTKHSLILLNKADLLPHHVRRAWADYFDKAGINYAFWSAAKAMSDVQIARQLAALGEHAHLAQDKVGEDEEGEDDDTRLLDVEELMDWMEQHARAAIQEADDDDDRKDDDERKVVVGLVGYPNVGKSSTINALFGSKKTAVAPTPGKTKHFQTLNVAPTLTLCDCPGLVFPRFTSSKADMVAAGVIPIDRLTDIRAPVEVVARRCGTRQLANTYGIPLASLKTSGPKLQGPRPEPTAGEILQMLASSRGWVASSALPDETRAGRQVLKDYTAGKLLCCTLPPGSQPPFFTPVGGSAGGNLEQAGGSTEKGKAGSLSSQQQQQQQQMYAPRAQQSQNLESRSNADLTPAGPAQQAGTRIGGGQGAALEAHSAEVGDDDEDEDEWEEDDGEGSGDEAGSITGGMQGESPEQRLENGGRLEGGGVQDEAAVVESTSGRTTSLDRLQENRGLGQGNGVSSAAVSVGTLDEMDLDLLQSLQPNNKQKSKRPEYKFHKKAARTKGTRGVERDGGGYDGAAMLTGKKGGLVGLRPAT